MAGSGDIKAGRAFVEVGVNDAGLAAGMARAMQQVQNFAAGMRATGMQVMAFGAAMLAPFALSTRTFAGFEKTMARVGSLAQANAEQFAALTTEAKRLGEETEFSANEASQMMAEFAQRGFKVNDILRASGPALAMATAGQLQLAEAAGISSDIMNGMQLNASKLSDVADIMTVAFRTSATDLRQLGEAFKYVGPDALAAGMSLEEITAAIQILSDAGIKADMAGTTLRGGLQSLINPSNEAKETLARLGVSIRNEQGGFRKFHEIVGDLTAGLEKLSEVDAAQAIGEIFTNRQATGFSVLTRRNQETGLSGADLLRQKAEALGPDRRKGAAFDVQRAQLNTIWGAWKLIESAIEGVAITIGEALAPTIREWGGAMLHGIGLLHDLVKQNKDWIPAIVMTGVAVVGLGAALVGVGVAATVAGVAMTGLATIGGAIAGVLGAVFSPVFLGIAAGVGLVAAVVSELGVTWESMTPILKAWGGYVLAVVAVAVGAVMLVVEVIKQVGKGIAWAMKATGDWLGKTFPDAVKGISGMFSSLVNRFAGFFDAIADTFSATWGGIVNAVQAGDLETAGEVAMAGFKVVWAQSVHFLTGVWRDFLWLFVGGWHASVRDMNLAWTKVWHSLEMAWFESFAWIGKAWGSVTDTMLKAFNTVVSKMSGSWTAFKSWISGTEGGLATIALEKGLKFDLSVNEINAAIDKARAEAEKKTNDERAALETRRTEAEAKIQQGYAAAEGAYQGETSKQLAEAMRDLTDAEKELSAALGKARANLVASPMVQAAAEAARAAKVPTTEETVARARQAAGGGAGPAAAAEVIGTFDSAMIRYLGDTTGDTTAKQQLREQQAQVEWLKKLFEAIKGLSPMKFK